jgi:thiamine biosynthesis lipoprotein
MNTDIEVDIPADRIEAVQAAFVQIEQRFSRFLPDSELSCFNTVKTGIPYLPSARFYQVLAIARDIEQWSEGLITPRVLPTLEYHGYNRSFEQIEKAAADPGLRPTSPLSVDPDQAWLDFDAGMRAVIKRRQTAIDLGGIVKGWSVDTIHQQLIANGTDQGMINAGGDLRVWGEECWEIEVSDPLEHFADEKPSVFRIKLAHGAVATSSIAKRRWGKEAHHIIDPRSGMPSRSDVIQATVAAPSTLQAEVLAKVWIILGREDASRWMARKVVACPAWLVMKNGETVRWRPTDE